LSALNPHPFQIGTFGMDVTTRPFFDDLFPNSLGTPFLGD